MSHRVGARRAPAAGAPYGPQSPSGAVASGAQAAVPRQDFLEHLRRPQVVDVDDAFQLASGIDYHK